MVVCIDWWHVVFRANRARLSRAPYSVLTASHPAGSRVACTGNEKTREQSVKQTALCTGLKRKKTQKDDDEGQAEPFRAGERTPAERRAKPSNDSERRDAREQDACWHRQRGSSPPAGEQANPRQRKQSSGG